MVIGLSGSLGDGDGSRLVSMTPTPATPFVCKCWIGWMEAGGGGDDKRLLAPGMIGPPWWPTATMVPGLTLPAAVPFWWSPSTGNPFSDRNSSRSQYWKTENASTRLLIDTYANCADGPPCFSPFLKKKKKIRQHEKTINHDEPLCIRIIIYSHVYIYYTCEFGQNRLIHNLFVRSFRSINDISIHK